jgi:hypothetical protein
MDVCDHCKHQVIPEISTHELTHKATNKFACYPYSNNPSQATRNTFVATLNGHTYVQR